MRRNYIFSKLVFFGAFALMFALVGDGFAQGRSRGAGAGNAGGNSGGGIGRGIGGGTSGFPDMSDRGGWDTRPDQGRATGSSRRDSGSEMRGRRVDSSNPGSQRFEGLSRRLGTSAADLQSQYQTARADNPDLTYGQWVAANMIAIHSPSNISAQQILDGLRDGKSIGQTLSSTGWDADRIKKERKRVKKEAGGDDLGYEDERDDWR